MTANGRATTYTVSLYPDDIALVEQAARRAGKSASETVRELIRLHLSDSSIAPVESSESVDFVTESAK